MLSRTTRPLSRRPLRLWLVGLVALVGVALVVVRTVPLLLWAYNVQRAGQALEVGMVWPTPSIADALPQARDAAALERARGHLAAAIQQRPAHAQAPWLAGRSYLAEGDWFRAVQALEQASQHASEELLLIWELALAYEQLDRLVVASSDPLDLGALGDAPLDAPAAAIETPFCTAGDPASCYRGETMFTLPLAGTAAATPLSVPTLFLHPPARVRHTLAVTGERSALRFLMGLDPTARDWGTDGAGFQLWVEGEGGERTLLLDRAMSAEEARAGWVPGWVDLSPWAGQTVTLVLETVPGPAQDTLGDWYGWGDLTLTDAKQIPAAMLIPRARGAAAWVRLGMTVATFVGRGDGAAAQQQPEAAFRWYARALSLSSMFNLFGVFFERVVQGIAAGHTIALEPLPAMETTVGAPLAPMLDPTLRLPGRALRLARTDFPAGLFAGSPLAAVGSDGTAGIIESGQPAVTLFQVPADGPYRVQATLRAPAALVTATLRVDDDATQTFELIVGGGGQTLEMPIVLAAGTHALFIEVQAVGQAIGPANVIVSGVEIGPEQP